MFFGVLLDHHLADPAAALSGQGPSGFLAASAGLGLVAAWVVWLDSREASQLARLELRISYAPQHCPADRPLQLTLNNGNDVPLTELRWRVAAYAPGDTVNLADNVSTPPRAIEAPANCRPARRGTIVFPTPPLRPGYRPETLEFRAEHLQGSFSD